MAVPLERLLARVPAESVKARRPSVTLSYAQSLDGSIGTASRKPLQLSGAESWQSLTACGRRVKIIPRCWANKSRLRCVLDPIWYQLGMNSSTANTNW